MGQLVLLRHGESMWNRENMFTGWVDVPLSEQGIQEALKAGEELADIDFSVIYVSTLDRAMATAMICLSKTHTGKTPVIIHDEEADRREKWAKIYSDKMNSKIIPVHRDWHLNERYYGELQGKNKKEMVDEYGADQVHIWRRSFDVRPPKGECLKDTADRTIPFFKETIMSQLASNKNILVVAHGNSLRSIVMYLDNLSSDEVVDLEIPTGVPLIYHYDRGGFSKE